MLVMKFVDSRMRKESSWWCKEVKLAIVEKRYTYEVWLQRKD